MDIVSITETSGREAGHTMKSHKKESFEKAKTLIARKLDAYAGSEFEPISRLAKECLCELAHFEDGKLVVKKRSEVFLTDRPSPEEAHASAHRKL